MTSRPLRIKSLRLPQGQLPNLLQGLPLDLLQWALSSVELSRRRIREDFVRTVASVESHSVPNTTPKKSVKTAAAVRVRSALSCTVTAISTEKRVRSVLFCLFLFLCSMRVSRGVGVELYRLVGCNQHTPALVSALYSVSHAQPNSCVLDKALYRCFGRGLGDFLPNRGRSRAGPTKMVRSS